MRAVLVFPAAPLPFGDTAARWFHLLACDLLARGASVSCLTVSDEPRERIEEARARLTEAAPAGRIRFQSFPLRAPVGAVRRKLRNVSRPFSELAQKVVAELPRNPERTVALRKLLEAKDAAVRARLAKIEGGTV